MKFLAPVLLGISSIACGGSDSAVAPPTSSPNSPEGEALFAVSGNATPDQILGVWTESHDDLGFQYVSRQRFAPDYVEVAARCIDKFSKASVIAYARVEAHVSNDDVETYESKTDVRTLAVDGRVNDCQLSIEMSKTPRCSFDRTVPFRSCFELKGTELTAYDRYGEAHVSTKISD